VHHDAALYRAARRSLLGRLLSAGRGAWETCLGHGLPAPFLAFPSLSAGAWLSRAAVGRGPSEAEKRSGGQRVGRRHPFSQYEEMTMIRSTILGAALVLAFGAGPGDEVYAQEKRGRSEHHKMSVKTAKSCSDCANACNEGFHHCHQQL